MKPIVEQAAAITEKVRERRNAAVALLSESLWPVNGYGVFTQRWTVIGDLNEAIKELTAIRDGLGNTSWPSPADYIEE